MPSRDRMLARDKMLVEVRRFLEAHKELRKGSHGPDPHNSVLKSAVVFVCATWEYYCENVAIEAAKKIAESSISPEKLPNEIKWQLAVSVHDAEVQKASAPSLTLPTCFRRFHRACSARVVLG